MSTAPVVYAPPPHDAVNQCTRPPFVSLPVCAPCAPCCSLGAVNRLLLLGVNVVGCMGYAYCMVDIVCGPSVLPELSVRALSRMCAVIGGRDQVPSLTAMQRLYTNVRSDNPRASASSGCLVEVAKEKSKRQSGKYLKSMKAAAGPQGSDGVHPGARLLVVREAPLDRMLALEARRGVALPLACPTLFDHRYCVTVTLGSLSTPSALSSPASSLSTLSPFAHLPSSTPSGTSVGPCFLLPPPKHNASALAFVAPQAASDPRAPQDRSASGRRAGDGVGLDVAGGGGVHEGDVGLRLLRFGEVEWAIVLERFPDVKYQLRGVPRKAWVGLPVVCQISEEGAFPSDQSPTVEVVRAVAQQRVDALVAIPHAHFSTVPGIRVDVEWRPTAPLYYPVSNSAEWGGAQEEL